LSAGIHIWISEVVLYKNNLNDFSLPIPIFTLKVKFWLEKRTRNTCLLNICVPKLLFLPLPWLDLLKFERKFCKAGANVQAFKLYVSKIDSSQICREIFENILPAGIPLSAYMKKNENALLL